VSLSAGTCAIADYTKISTAHANGCRAPDFKAKGAEVFGVSSGSAEDKEKFLRTTKATAIELLIDAGDVLRKSWAVPRALFGAFPGKHCILWPSLASVHSSSSVRRSRHLRDW
jgi:hypothetical protein